MTTTTTQTEQGKVAAAIRSVITSAAKVAAGGALTALIAYFTGHTTVDPAIAAVVVLGLREVDQELLRS